MPSENTPTRRTMLRFVIERQERCDTHWTTAEVSEDTDELENGDQWNENVPWFPYTQQSMRCISLCEETGWPALEDGRCRVHGGDACLYLYRHPYDNAVDRWKKGDKWI